MNENLKSEIRKFVDIIDKEYFDVSEEDRDAIARLIVLEELLNKNIHSDMNLMYDDYLTVRIKNFEENEDYESADLFKRIKKQINLATS